MRRRKNKTSRETRHPLGDLRRAPAGTQAMSIASSSTPPLGTHAWLAQLQGGAIGSIVSLAVILTLGLLAYAPLGALAPEVGIPAAFTSAVVGGLAMALLATSALPTAGPSSA